MVNARDALPEGGHVSIETNIINSTTFARGNNTVAWVCLCVTDDGAGMSGEVRKRVFEPFFSTKETNGTGLGLSTLDSIVKQAGGEVHIDSQLAKGTSVSVYLPSV